MTHYGRKASDNKSYMARFEFAFHLYLSIVFSKTRNVWTGLMLKKDIVFQEFSSNGVSIKSSVNILTFKKELMFILNYTFRNQK